jgi:hypothetical protein
MVRIRTVCGGVAVATACLVALLALAPCGYAQQSGAPKKPREKRSSSRKPAGNAQRRPANPGGDAFVADRVRLRGGGELLGQIDDEARDGAIIVIARREAVRKALPAMAAKWEEAERQAGIVAQRQRRDRLEAWRRERQPTAAPGDPIMAWIDRELSDTAPADASPPLMALRFPRSDVASIERRSEASARTLRQAWLLGLSDPEKTSPARLREALAAKGISLAGDDMVSIDGLLPLTVESSARWSMRRAATEVLHDDGLRFLRFGNTLLPEPVPGQPVDPAATMALVEGSVRDVLGVGAGDPLPRRLREAEARGRVGLMITTIVIAPDLSDVSAESALYYCEGEWGRGLWRTQRLEVGSVPPAVVSIVANDPQVKAIMGLIDAIGAGFVSPAMKEKGLVVGTTVGGAVVLARTSLVRSLMEIAFDIDGRRKAIRPERASEKAAATR